MLHIRAGQKCNPTSISDVRSEDDDILWNVAINNLPKKKVKTAQLQ